MAYPSPEITANSLAAAGNRFAIRGLRRKETMERIDAWNAFGGGFIFGRFRELRLLFNEYAQRKILAKRSKKNATPSAINGADKSSCNADELKKWLIHFFIHANFWSDRNLKFLTVKLFLTEPADRRVTAAIGRLCF